MYLFCSGAMYSFIWIQLDNILSKLACFLKGFIFFFYQLNIASKKRKVLGLSPLQAQI